MSAAQIRTALEHMLERCRSSAIPTDMIDSSAKTLAEIADDDLLALARAVQDVRLSDEEDEDYPDHDGDGDDAYIYGCGQDDTVDSSGEKLRPAINEAGEPWWM